MLISVYLLVALLTANTRTLPLIFRQVLHPADDKEPSNVYEIVRIPSGLGGIATAAEDEVGLTWLLVFDLTCLCKTGRNIPFLFHIPASAAFSPPAKFKVLCEALTLAYSPVLLFF
jgi:hypothetical protein